MPIPPPKPERRQSAASIITTAVLLGVILGGIAGGIVGALTSGKIGDLFGQSSAATGTINASSLEQNLTVQENSATIDSVNAVAPAVGSVLAIKEVSPFSLSPDSPFDFFFGTPDTNTNTNTEPQKQEVSGGTGFIISSDGLILTNKHVVSDTDAEYVFLTYDNERLDATVVGRDPFNDLAILKVNTDKELPIVTIGDSSEAQLGQTVIAIGNTLSRYRNTVTRGIISGISRTIQAGDPTGQTETIDEVLQTDAAINPGNSGGPLIDLTGNVIGINTAVGTGENIGFAIPINAAKPIIKTAIEQGRVVRPYLGIRYITITPEIQQANDLPVDYGALIPESNGGEPSVAPDSAAATAGLQEGDIILDIDGIRVDEDTTIAQIMRDYLPGDSATLGVLRDGKEITVSVTLGELEG